MGKAIFHNVSKYSPLSDLDEAIKNSDTKDPDHLCLTYSSYDDEPLSEKQIDELLILLGKTNIKITQLVLDVNLDIIQTEKFKRLIRELNSDAMRYIKLNFGKSVSKKQVNKALVDSKIADLAFYPIKLALLGLQPQEQLMKIL